MRPLGPVLQSSRERDADRAAIRSTGCGFSLYGACFGSFPSLNIRQFPACAAGGQTDWLWKGRIVFNPTARRQVMDIVSCANLTVSEIDCRHLRLHRYVWRCKSLSAHSRNRAKNRKNNFIAFAFFVAPLLRHASELPLTLFFDQERFQLRSWPLSTSYPQLRALTEKRKSRPYQIQLSA